LKGPWIRSGTSVEKRLNLQIDISFVHSSTLIAQINVQDLWHKKANEISEYMERTDRKVILPAEVLAETLV
jgi:hypothetical protein